MRVSCLNLEAGGWAALNPALASIIRSESVKKPLCVRLVQSARPPREIFTDLSIERRAGLLLEIDVRERLPVGVADDEAGVGFSRRPLKSATPTFCWSMACRRIPSTASSTRSSKRGSGRDWQASTIREMSREMAAPACWRSQQRSSCWPRFPQCDISTGTVIDSMKLRVMPPSTNSRNREWP